MWNSTNIAILGAVGTAFVVFWITFGLVCYSRRRWEHVSFHPHKFVRNLDDDKWVLKEETHSFEPRLGAYMKLAEVVTTLAAASMVFIPRITVTIYPAMFAYSMVSLALSVLFAILFMLMLLFWYEDALYLPMNYTVRRSAVVLGLGFTGLACFAFAYLVLAFQLARAVGAGLPIATP
jgi:hypothetical protein